MARIRRHRRDIVQSPQETYIREINDMALLTAD
jgi:RNA polymerase primary sigma factor